MESNIKRTKSDWLYRLGAILTSKFRHIIIKVDRVNYKISLWESGYSATVYIFDDGHLEWDEFDDIDIGRSNQARLSGEKFYRPIIKIIEQYYYSSEYDDIKEFTEFKSRLDNGKYSKKGDIYCLIAFSIWIGVFLVLYFLFRNHDSIRVFVGVASTIVLMAIFYKIET